jgi:hypothetical protein
VDEKCRPFQCITLADAQRLATLRREP